MSGKYWEKYQEKKLKLERTCKTPTHKSDKDEYLNSLETQLEKSNHSNLLLSTFSDRIDQLQKQLNTAEERISNLSLMFKIQTTDNTEITPGGLFLKLEERVSALENSSNNKNDSYKLFSASVDSSLRETEKRITKLIEDFEEK